MLKRVKAFTLAEVLVAMGVLGIMSTFSIAKIVQNYQILERKALLKETVSAIQDSFHRVNLEGKYTSADVVKGLGDNLNTVSAEFNPNYFGLPFYWITLPNGAFIIIASYTNDPNDFYDIVIDINGDGNPPNVKGEDILHLIAISKRSNWGGACGEINGKLFAPSPALCNFWGTDTLRNYTLYNSLFSG